MIKQLAQWVVRYAWPIVIFAVLSAGVGGYFSLQLYKNLRPDLDELLPKTARSVKDIDEVTRRFRSIDSLGILIFSQNKAGSKRLVNDLARSLRENAPSDLVDRIEFKIDREIQFFRKRRALYVDLGDLTRARDYIKHRIEYEKDLYNPLNIFSETLLPEPKFDFKALEKKYQSMISNYNFPDGYFATQDESVRAVLVYMSGRISSTERIKKLKAIITDSLTSLKPQSYAGDVQIHYTGELQSILDEHDALTSDIEVSGVVVSALVIAILLLYFRSLSATLSLIISLFIGTAWTFGIAFFAVGHLNANSAFLGSIVIGNGINFGIIFLARYLELRRAGQSHDDANGASMLRTYGATLTAALSASMSYGSLMLTDFRGFSQFGFIGLTGMILCWISSYTVFPAILTLIEKVFPAKRPKRQPRIERFLAGFSKAVARRAVPIIFLAVGISLFSAFYMSQASRDIFETDLTRLRSKAGLDHGSAYYVKYLDEIFKRYLTPIAILTQSTQHSQEVATFLRNKKKTEGATSLIESVQTIQDFIPSQQLEKIKLLKEIKQTLTPRMLREISPREKKLVNQFLTPESTYPVRISDLPPLVLASFSEKDGNVGKLVLVAPPISRGPLPLPDLLRFVGDLRAVADATGIPAPVAGALPVSADIMSSIERDGPRATAFAFGGVVLLCLLLFRHLKTLFFAVFALVLGVLWLAGIIFGLNLKINFLNFVALPITFGIGVDYGVNILQRFRQEQQGERHMNEVIKSTGGAVVLCSLTTIIGYSSLLLAQNQALESFGVLAVLGEICCLSAAVIVLPALFVLLGRRSRNRNKKEQLAEQVIKMPRMETPKHEEVEEEIKRAA